MSEQRSSIPSTYVEVIGEPEKVVDRLSSSNKGANTVAVASNDVQPQERKDSKVRYSAKGTVEQANLNANAVEKLERGSKRPSEKKASIVEERGSTRGSKRPSEKQEKTANTVEERTSTRGSKRLSEKQEKIANTVKERTSTRGSKRLSEKTANVAEERTSTRGSKRLSEKKEKNTQELEYLTMEELLAIEDENEEEVEVEEVEEKEEEEESVIEEITEEFVPHECGKVEKIAIEDEEERILRTYDDILKELPEQSNIPQKIMKFYLYDEVCIHNKWYDFWIVIHGNVLDLSPLLKDRRDSWNSNLEYLTAFGGKDLSHLFHKDGQPKTETSPMTGRPRLLFPPILEVALSSYCKSYDKIWSQDVFYHIGRITRRERRLRIINTLTMTTQLMKVCDEDTIFDIQEKYKSLYNSHAGSYLWRKFSHGGKTDGKLRFSGTLDENGLDEPESEIELPPPSIWLYYTDDFTIA